LKWKEAMTCDLSALRVSAADPARLVRFWGELLGWSRGPGHMLVPGDDTGFVLRFTPTTTPKTSQNLMHFDLTSSSLADQQETVARALEVGGRHCDVGQRGDEGHVVLADPEGNEFCVIQPGNTFLAECGFVGALACDGSQAVGYFWSEVLGWPLVWDENQETAIRSPRGGPKITWGGEQPVPSPSRNRFRFELTPAAGSDRRSEMERLISLGASRVADGVVLADPDGNEFYLGGRPQLPKVDPAAAAGPRRGGVTEGGTATQQY
jgi:predicted enzyme related to lactoylglutathione lyase